jgi:hypothetical protein
MSQAASIASGNGGLDLGASTLYEAFAVQGLYQLKPGSMESVGSFIPSVHGMDPFVG